MKQRRREDEDDGGLIFSFAQLAFRLRGGVSYPGKFMACLHCGCTEAVNQLEIERVLERERKRRIPCSACGYSLPGLRLVSVELLKGDINPLDTLPSRPALVTAAGCWAALLLTGVGALWWWSVS